MAESRADRRGDKERASVRSTSRLLGGCRASAMAASFGPGGRSRLVWNDVNVEVRGECYELFYERFAAEEGRRTLLRSPVRPMTTSKYPTGARTRRSETRRRRRRRFPYVLRAARLGRYWLQAWRAHHRSWLACAGFLRTGRRARCETLSPCVRRRGRCGDWSAPGRQTKIRSWCSSHGFPARVRRL